MLAHTRSSHPSERFIDALLGITNAMSGPFGGGSGEYSFCVLPDVWRVTSPRLMLVCTFSVKSRPASTIKLIVDKKEFPDPLLFGPTKQKSTCQLRRVFSVLTSAETCCRTCEYIIFYTEFDTSCSSTRTLTWSALTQPEKRFLQLYVETRPCHGDIAVSA